MRNQTLRPHKRNKAVMVLLLPVVAILWLMGWSLYWVGSRKQMDKSWKRERIEDLTLTVIMPEQKHAE